IVDEDDDPPAGHAHAGVARLGRAAVVLLYDLQQARQRQHLEPLLDRGGRAVVNDDHLELAGAERLLRQLLEQPLDEVRPIVRRYDYAHRQGRLGVLCAHTLLTAGEMATLPMKRSRPTSAIAAAASLTRAPSGAHMTTLSAARAIGIAAWF